MKRFLVLLAVLAALAVAPAHAALQVDVTTANPQPLPIAIPDFMGDPQAGPNIAGVVRADLERSGLFRPLDQKGFVEHITDINKVPTFASWRSITAQGLVTGQVAMQPDGRLRVDFRLWDVYGESQMLGLQFFTTPAICAPCGEPMKSGMAMGNGWMVPCVMSTRSAAPAGAANTDAKSASRPSKILFIVLTPTHPSSGGDRNGTD